MARPISSPKIITPSKTISRRGALALGGAALAATTPLSALAQVPVDKDRTLSFHNIHNGENLRVIYYADGQYLEDARKEIEWILRDWRTNEATRMDVKLFDILHDLRDLMDSTEPFHIISGYRSPKTNAMLRKQGRGVAKKSQHMLGNAADVYLPNRDLDKLRAAARSLKRGGVGYYPKPGFIHVDTGRVRYW